MQRFRRNEAEDRNLGRDRSLVRVAPSSVSRDVWTAARVAPLPRLVGWRPAIHGHRRPAGAVPLVNLRSARVWCARCASSLPRFHADRPSISRGPFAFRARAGGRHREGGRAECVESGPAEVKPRSLRTSGLGKVRRKWRFAKRTSRFSNSHMSAAEPAGEKSIGSHGTDATHVSYRRGGRSEGIRVQALPSLVLRYLR
jgi:hypothetical protein